ncbi:hypothetical protein CSA56_16100 [candidate division KSB3 bacterium]|uniref:Zinc finger/thioredoxin putative domain-containing protein n=1 Tax=candidate division KSB3 bacterium TaxID=2044937 RepID=A0A2G6K8Y8_9BACT|nr:MAG: hypothetical protein CSA56_16100 [candidate division KSB3 bacterium]
MRVQCPQCGVGGKIPDDQIPSNGRSIICPKCKNAFFVKRAFSQGTPRSAAPDVTSIYHEGVQLLKQKQLDAAIEKLGAVIQRDPGYAKAYRYLGLAYGQKNLWDEAVDMLQQAIALKPQDVLSLKNLGIAYLRQEQFSEAVEVLQQALQRVPDDAKAKSFFKMALQKQQAQQAVNSEALSPDAPLPPQTGAAGENASYGQPVEIPHNPVQEFLDRGTEFLDNGQHNKAIEMFEEAIRLAPESSDGHFGLGMVYEKLQEKKKAIDAYQKAVTVNPDDSLALKSLKYLKKQKKGFKFPWKK